MLVVSHALKLFIEPTHYSSTVMSNYLVACLIVLLSLPVLANDNDRFANKNKTITIAYHNYRPYYDASGAGMVTDIYKEAFSRRGIDVVMRSYPIRRGIKKLFDQEVDAFSPGRIFIVEKELQEQLISVPSFIVMIGWISKPDKSTDFSGNLDGEIFLTSRADFVDVYKNKGMVVRVVENPVQQVKMLMVGRADYSEFSLLAAWHSIYRNDKHNLGGIKFTKTLGAMVADLAFIKHNPRAKNLSSEFAKGLETMMRDGTYIDILERYWGQGNVPKDVLFDELKGYGTNNFNSHKIAELLD